MVMQIKLIVVVVVVDYNGIAFSIELLEWGSHILGFLGYESSSYVRLTNVPGCLYCG